MQDNKEAFILIPGLDSNEKNANRHRLVTGFLNVPESARLEEMGESTVIGEAGVRLKATIGHSSEKIIDCYEANWWDLTVTKAEENSFKKMRQGFSLLKYWFFSRVWGTVFKSPYMTLSVVLSSLLLIMWYYGILVLAFTAIGSNPDMIPSAATQNWGTELAQAIGKAGKVMGGWYIWAAASLLMGFLPLNSLVRISSFTKRYLQNEPMEDGVGVRDKIRNRVKETLDRILQDGSYSRVTILTHSFGTVVGVDILADYKFDPDRSIRFVTIGSPLYFLSYRSRWIDNEVKKCLANEFIDSWLDFYSDEDWLCSKIPGHGEGDKTGQQSIPIKHEASLARKLRGQTHLAYFSSQPVMEMLVT